MIELRKFFFDDVRDVPDSDWTLARDVTEAKKILSEQQFDVWSLDHDIGFQMMCEPCYTEWVNAPVLEAIEDVLRKGCTHIENGTTLAQWAVENITIWPELIVIHSANPYGAERMHNLLKSKTECLRIPYNLEALRSIQRK